MKFTKEGVDQSVDKLLTASVMTSHQHHVIKREIRVLDAINVLDVFCSCYTAISAASQT